MNYQIFVIFKFFMVLCKKMYNNLPIYQPIKYVLFLRPLSHTNHTHIHA